MPCLSSRATFRYKWIFPAIWFGFLLIFVATSFFQGSKAASPVPFLLAPLAMAVFGYFIMKKFVFDLADEVLDAGDALVVRKGQREERIALSDIMNVSYSPLVNPPRVTLSLRTPGTFGNQISFCAPLRFVPFSSSPAIDELIQRIDAARRRR
jgi:hypothetical protein